jgi:hypothetical protein
VCRGIFDNVMILMYSIVISDVLNEWITREFDESEGQYLS